ncbi:MAG: hypothetical protein LH472_02005 [Pyrinomonadaceae bacterium]|nr:hypothetical protein [Pyrinomonadaceae bacterium]
MGQIVIETPFEISRIYKIESRELAAELLASLEKSAQQMQDPPPEIFEYFEDIEDIIAAREALSEEGTISFEDVKKELGL